MKRWMLAVMVVGLMYSATGCNQGVVRSQNPGPVAFNGGMPGEGGEYRAPAGIPAGPVYYDGPAWGADGMTCPCPPGQPDIWRPTHHHTWEYNPPKGLVYPPANQPPAVMQYPYYTCKGPSDFFYTGR